jgi:glycerol-3-phosphate dehydrogenase
MIRLGLFLYDHLGGRQILAPTRSLNLATAPEGKPIRKNFKRAFEYSDCWVDDARLVVLNAVDVRNRGGVVLTRTSLLSARRAGEEWRVDLRGSRDGRSLTSAAKAIINAAGPWVEDVLHRAGRNVENRVRLVKGSHIVTRKFWNGDQAYLLQHSDKRVIFVNPLEGELALIGTTDIPFEGRAEDVRIDRSEIAYLLSIVDRYFEHGPKFEEVVHSFSGVRPLFDDRAANPSAVTRDYVLEVEGPAGQAPFLSIFGGKITTYRRLAEHALEKLSPYFPQMTGPWTKHAPLPGGDIPEADFTLFLQEQRRRRPWLPQEVARGYGRRYGTRVESLLDGARSISDLGRLFGGTLYEREARFLAEEEWATDAEDVLERRTKHALHLTDGQRADFTAWFAMFARQAVL